MKMFVMPFSVHLGPFKYQCILTGQVSNTESGAPFLFAAENELQYPEQGGRSFRSSTSNPPHFSVLQSGTGGIFGYFAQPVDHPFRAPSTTRTRLRQMVSLVWAASNQTNSNSRPTSLNPSAALTPHPSSSSHHPSSLRPLRRPRA